MPHTPSTTEKYSGFVWILSALSLIAYGTLTLTNQHVPGVEQLVAYLSTVEGAYIYGAAFLSIFIEGLYVVGSFFPGSTLVVLLTIISQLGGVMSYVTTVGVIFAGWCAAGVVNIFLAKFYGAQILKQSHDGEYQVKDRFLTTWFPSFRANYEVAQITEGGNPYLVLWSSIKVKFFASVIMLAGMAIVPLVIDIHEISNEEGSISVFTVAAISFTVGVMKIRASMSRDNSAR